MDRGSAAEPAMQPAATITDTDWRNVDGREQDGAAREDRTLDLTLTKGVLYH